MERHGNQTDHILIQDGIQVCSMSVLFRGADYNTDHYLVVTNLGRDVQ
jgi:hypothetical protein